MGTLNNMKKTWKVINELLTIRKKKLNIVSALKKPSDCNRVTPNPLRISNISNKLFATIGNKLGIKLSPQGNYMDYLSKSKSPDMILLSSFFQPVLQDEVKVKILSLSNNLSRGLYSCPVQQQLCE